MARQPRRRGDSDIYHVYTRGVNGEAIFHDDADRKKMCYVIGDSVDDYGGELLAWCLMPNHIHIVLRNDFARVPQQIATLKSRYARYFNNRHDRYGHLFQGRYGSKPVDTETYLLTVIRYVHLNPVAAGLSRTCTYPWSSYQDFGPPGAWHQVAQPGRGGHGHRPEVATESVLETFGGYRRFAAAHALAASAARGNPADLERGLEDAEIISAIERELGANAAKSIRTADAPERDRLLRAAKALGFSNRRLARAIGLSRSVIQRA